MIGKELEVRSVAASELLNRHPDVGNIHQILSRGLEQLKANEKMLMTLADSDVVEIVARLAGESERGRPSHAAVWLAILAQAELERPGLAFWRGDSLEYMQTAESGQFSILGPTYSMRWSREHNSNLMGKFGIGQLSQLYGSGKIWLRQHGVIDTGIGWFIGTVKDGDTIGKYMDIFQFEE
jgi:hypothetical protein